MNRALCTVNNFFFSFYFSFTGARRKVDLSC